jgi:23S rRNA pseudouridine1911/1915/1917 synthase
LLSVTARWRADGGERTLDGFLEERLPQLGRLRLRAGLAAKQCLVDGVARHKGFRLRGGEVVEWLGRLDGPGEIRAEAGPLEVLFEDGHLLVVVKPAGMLAHPTHRVRSGTLLNLLLGRTGWARLAHRLDRETSGVMAAAKNARALNLLAKQFQAREVSKSYGALVSGVVREEAVVVEAPIGRDPGRRPQQRVMEGGRAARSELRVVERREGETLVDLIPVTGRTNQLRIHCAHLGHPVVGDEWYGGRRAERLYLHAERLGFRHPETGEWLEFRSPAGFARG